MGAPAGVIASARRAAPAPTGPTFRGTTRLPSGSSTVTYSAVPIGPEAATRTVIAVVTWRSPSGRNVNGVTIGGVTATADQTTAPTGNGFTVWRATVPTGTAADVVVTCSNGDLFVAVSVWTVSGPVTLQSAATSGTLTAGSTGSTVTAPTTSAGGFVLAAMHSRSSPFTTSWGGVTERWDDGLDRPTSGGDGSTTSGGATVTATFSTAIDSGTVVGVAAYSID